jgi:uncharacterized protein YbjT (DUF2867 family)
MPRPLTVVVAGATGRQGGAVARDLLRSGHRVRALTRRPGSQAAALLHLEGAELHEADLDDLAAVERAAAGADAFFLVTTPFEEGVEAEARQGRRAAEAARNAGVGHLVFSSVAGAGERTQVPHFESKREIERYLQELGLPHTVVAPVFFMENFLGPAFLDALRAGTLAMPLPAGRPLQLVPAADLAALVRLALERPSELRGKRLEIASDERTGPEIAAALAHASGASIGYSAVPLERMRARSADLALMWEWLGAVGYHADVAGLRRAYPEVGWHDLGRWAREQDWTVIDAASPEQPTA